MLHRISLSTFIVLAFLCHSGCQQPDQPLPLEKVEKNYDRALPPGQFALRKVTDPSKYPHFGEAWFRARGIDLRKSVLNSLEYLEAPSSRTYYPMGPITHERAMASLRQFLDVLDHAESPEVLDQLVRERFDVYTSVGWDGSGTVLFTGYYSPIFEGSLTRTEQFRYPIYKLPPEIEKDAEGNVVGGPWASREEIERNHLLEGNEIAWLGDRFEAYVFTVQGSGFIRLPDDTLYEIGYAGHNGHEYTSIGRALVEDGKIDRYRLSLASMIRHFKQYPQDMDTYLYQNKRTVFFQDSKGGPYGCLGKPVTAYHTIATDKEIFPRGCLAFVNTRIPNRDDPRGRSRAFRCFAMDQDRGAAIRAPGRCDIYMGVGDEAEKIAGFPPSEGRLYYLFAKEGIEDVEAVTATMDGGRNSE